MTIIITLYNALYEKITVKPEDLHRMLDKYKTLYPKDRGFNHEINR